MEFELVYYDVAVWNYYKIEFNKIEILSLKFVYLQFKLFGMQCTRVHYEISICHSSRYSIAWCNGYRRRKWTRRHEFKSWTKLIAFHIALIPLGKVWIQLFSLQLWVNSWADWIFSLGEATSLGEGKPWIQTCQTPLKNDLVSYPAQAEGLAQMIAYE